MASDVTNYLKRIYDLIESQSMRLQRGTPPILLDAATNVEGTKIVLTFSKIMSQYMFTGITQAFSASAKTISSVARGTATNTIEITVDTAYANGATIKLYYNIFVVPSGRYQVPLESIDLGLVEAFSSITVTNNVPA